MYDFDVKREPLYRKDGVDSNYDAIYRADNGIQLSVVSRGYQLVTHKQAMEYVFEELESKNLKYETQRIDLTNQAKKMHYELTFPEEEFDIPGDESTGVPSLKIYNSIDRSRSFGLSFGTYRVICTNGLSMGKDIIQVSEAHYMDRIKFVEIIPSIMHGIENVRGRMIKNANRLLAEDADIYFKYLVEAFPPAFVMLVAEQMQKYFEWETYVKAGMTLPKPGTVETTQTITAYELLQVITAIATHQVKSSLKRMRIDSQIVRLMNIE